MRAGDSNYERLLRDARTQTTRRSRTEQKWSKQPALGCKLEQSSDTPTSVSLPWVAAVSESPFVLGPISPEDADAGRPDKAEHPALGFETALTHDTGFYENEYRRVFEMIRTRSSID